MEIMVKNISSYFIDFIYYTKYFLYFNFFMMSLLSNLIYYFSFGKINNSLIKNLYYVINLNGCVLIKFVQWTVTNIEPLENDESKIILDLFYNFYENCDVHGINYTKQLFYDEYGMEFDSVFVLDDNFKVKSGSIAQVYKAKFKTNDYLITNLIDNLIDNSNNFNSKNNLDDVAIKVVHPQIKYQMYFPIKFINFYQYCIQNFDCLKKYGTIFDFDSFFENLQLQINMNNEFNNMKYFYNYYSNNEYIVIPKPIVSSRQILIMEFLTGSSIEDLDVSEYEKKQVILLLNLFMKNGYYFLDYIHSDLHQSNWKVRKYKDFCQLIVYDYGYVLKSDSEFSNTTINFMFYMDTFDLTNLAKLLYENITNIKNISIHDFSKQYINSIQNIIPFSDALIVSTYNFCYKNNYILKNNLLELFISMILLKKHFKKYIFTSKKNMDSNFIMSCYINCVSLSKKYNIFNDLATYIEEKFLNNETLISKYDYKNNIFDSITSNNEIIINSDSSESSSNTISATDSPQSMHSIDI